MSKKLVSVVLVLTFALTILAGCGGSAPSAADAQKQICTALTGLKANVDQFAATDPQTKVADIKALKAKVDPVVQNLKTINGVLKQPKIDEMVASYDSLSKSIDSLSGETLGATSDQIKAGSQTVSAAFDQANTALNCGK
jgi:hypothetical protein